MKGRWVKWGANLFTRSGLVSTIERVEANNCNLLRILDYHRIGEPGSGGYGYDPSLVSASPVAFAQQMEFIKREYNPISVEDLLDVLAGRKTLPPRAIMVTFDDGYHDFLDHAWPVLRRLEIPAMLFVVTDYLSDPCKVFWWDRLYQAIHRSACIEIAVEGLGCLSLHGDQERRDAFESIKRKIMALNHAAAMQTVEELVLQLGVDPQSQRVMLNWDELRAMAQDGLYVGAHTISHPILSRMTPEEAQTEITVSHGIIKDEIGQNWPVFAYPVGRRADLRPELLTILKDEGFQAAMTMFEGHNEIGRTPPLELKRVGMAAHVSLIEFRLVLTRAYDLYGRLKRQPNTVPG